ncbi:MAG TPA: class I SAM-dependent methyltransferase, partial [Pyrinomonadaceae bacterium]|nr:class I SAM-dependent methyltransferase [Pyrinomonadaceae bacterium]
FSQAMIDRAKVRLGETGQSNVSFAVADITSRWPCDDESYDLVTCSLVLEHIKEIDFIFAESSRCLRDGGRLFLCELHPYRQYAGTKANFTRDQKVTQIDSFVHHVSDFLDGTARNGLSLESLKEWWHEEDKNKPPRLLSLMFSKSSQNHGR